MEPKHLHFAGRRVLMAARPSNLSRQLGLRLGLLGCVVRSAADADHLVASLEREAFDLLMVQPGLSPHGPGHVLERLGRHDLRRPRRDHVPVVAITSLALPSEKLYSLQAGFDDCLSLPFSRDDLVQLLQRWVPAHGASA